MGQDFLKLLISDSKTKSPVLTLDFRDPPTTYTTITHEVEREFHFSSNEFTDPEAGERGHGIYVAVM